MASPGLQRSVPAADPADRSRAHRDVPPGGPRYRTPFGLYAAIRRDPLAFLFDAWQQHGDVVRMHAPPWTSFFFVHPLDVKHILQENHRNYWKGVIFGKLKRIAGEGLVFSDGELWRRQRQLVQPAFHRDRIAALGDMMVRTTAEMLERWRRRGAAQLSLDIAAEMSTLTLDIVAQALFGADLGEDKAEFCAAVSEAMVYANHLTNHMFTPPLIVPTRANRAGRRAVAGIDRVVWKIIETRRRDNRERHDLLGMLIAARDAETNQAMNDRQLRDEAVTFLVAGHETTAVALSWSWYLLSQHAEARARLFREVDDVLGTRPARMSDLPDLSYTRMVLDEALRLYPPAWATARQAHADDEVGGVRVPRNTVITLSPYVTHRHPEFWERPDEFDPERFTPERCAARPDFAYFPFGGGPRGCVGRQFATMEGQLLLATIAQQFRLDGIPGHRVEPDPILTLRPRHGMPMTARRRAS